MDWIIKKVVVTPGGREVQPLSTNLTKRGATLEEILAAALATALNQNAVVRIYDAKNTSAIGPLVTPLPDIE